MKMKPLVATIVLAATLSAAAFADPGATTELAPTPAPALIVQPAAVQPVLVEQVPPPVVVVVAPRRSFAQRVEGAIVGAAVWTGLELAFHGHGHHR